MTREETIKLLSILKAAYPNSYKGMTKEEASGTIAVWSMQFADIPANIMLIAVNKLISTSPFPPAISEVREKLRGLYYEATNMLSEHEYATKGFKICDNDPDEEPTFFGNPLDDRTLAVVKDIIRVTSTLRGNNRNETRLSDMLTQGSGRYYLETNGGE